MFDGLKKKFSSFIDSLVKKEEGKEAEELVHEEANVPVESTEALERPEPEKIDDDREEGREELLENERTQKESEQTAYQRAIEEDARRKVDEKKEEERMSEERDRREIAAKPVPEMRHEEKHEQKYTYKKVEEKQVIPEGQEHEHTEKKEYIEVQAKKKVAIRHEENKLNAKVSALTKLKGILFKNVEINDDDVSELLENLRMALLQSDVNYDVADKIVNNMHDKLVGGKLESRNIEYGIRSAIRESLSSTLQKGTGIDLIGDARKKAAGERPYKIMFIGPNGAGKTTTIAKIARMFMDNGLTCVLSASDTFRAAAIEQTAHHANRLGVNVVKGQYGADPASIAFDAIAYAKAHGVDVVLIDTAGRQDTNKNLLEEMKKITRIASPDMKIFVGESIAGNALLEQVKKFNEAIGLNGIILTKLDCDAKGGNTLSILSDTEIPVIFFGTGEDYDALVKYNPDIILNNIIPEAS